MTMQKSVDFRMLFPPNMNYDYFGGHESLEFESNESRCNLGNAWWLAESSLLAYEHPGFVRFVLKSIGAAHYKFFTWNTTQVIVFTLGKACIVAFRGTEVKSAKMIGDIISDVHFAMVDFYGKGLVHKGFKLAFDEAVTGPDNLENYIEELLHAGEADSVYFTGHSLGGALATLASSYFARLSGPLYTFGAPRVGNAAFCETLPRLSFRFINAGDPVPYLPPNLPGLAKEQNFFTHAGNALYLDESKNLVANPSAEFAPHNLGGLLGSNIKSVAFNVAKHAMSIMSGAKRGNAASVIRDSNMDAHAPVLYAVYIWNYLASQKMNPTIGEI